MESTLNNLAAYLPTDLDVLSMLKFVGLVVAAALILGFIFRLILGKNSDLNHALSCAIAILFIYAVTVVIYSFNITELRQYMSPLPFVSFEGSSLVLFSLTTAEFPAICSQVLSMVILAFLVNLLDTIIPRGKNTIRWFFFRIITIVLAIGAHYLVTWAFNTFLPGTLVTYAPTILLCVLVGLILLGLIRFLLGLVLTIASPIIGGIYAFFFSNKIGKQLSKAVLTTALLTALVLILEHFGYTVISIASGALSAYIPLIAALLVIWYIIGHIL